MTWNKKKDDIFNFYILFLKLLYSFPMYFYYQFWITVLAISTENGHQERQNFTPNTV